MSIEIVGYRWEVTNCNSRQYCEIEVNPDFMERLEEAGTTVTVSAGTWQECSGALDSGILTGNQ